ncbi:MAG: mismatch-specific DNA-glycosylase [Actinomycetota bacterium]|jgi:TDG/mug DNA glycosylase family protein|nr:mismatch-specific DNA-glycosylase [Actinomycetota bacterium]
MTGTPAVGGAATGEGAHQGTVVVALGEPADLPVRLARLHAGLPTGTGIEVAPGDADVPVPLPDLLTGGGFAPVGPTLSGGVRGTRAHSLADTVGPGMRLVVCGLNPSPAAARTGVGFAHPGNRFWTAARAAGVVTADRDPFHALDVDGVGMTDLVKRTTRAAGELGAGEYRAGVHRLVRLVAWLAPGAVCFVGLAGWRAAVDPSARAGLQPGLFGGRPVYVMPSTSGANARTSATELTAHLRRAAELAGRVPAR